MSKPRYRWWGYVRNVIRSYPALREMRDELQATSVTSNYGGGSNGGGDGRALERAALRELDPQEQKELEAVEQAIRYTQTLPNGRARLAIIQLVYWERTHTVDGAGRKVGYQPRQARQIHGDFVRSVARNMGLLDKSAPQSHKTVV